MWTKEVIIFAGRLGVETSDLDEPVTYVVDDFGNKLLCDGNHRAFKAICEGREPNGIQIGTINGNISEDEWCRRVKDLTVVNYDPPTF